VTNKNCTISVLVPTRKRQADVTQLVATGLEMTTRENSLEFCFCFDDDDNISGEFIPKLKRKYPENIKYIEVERNRFKLSELTNQCYSVSTGELLLMLGDDFAFRTRRWNELVIAEFLKYPDNILLAYGYDGHQPAGKLATHGVVHRDWVNVLGYCTPPYFSCDYADTWLYDVATAINRCICLDIYFEHLHPMQGKHECDDTHRERLERGKRDNNQALYSSSQMKSLREVDVAKLQSFIESKK